MTHDHRRPRCTICAHSRRGDIETALLSGMTCRAVAGEFAVSAQSAQRHFSLHPPLIHRTRIQPPSRRQLARAIARQLRASPAPKAPRLAELRTFDIDFIRRA